MSNVTIVWPMPPLRGISQYVVWFVSALSKNIEVDVLWFRDMYPEKLYPWWSYIEKDKEKLDIKNVSEKQVLDRWNPIWWIYHTCKIRTKFVHLQYRVWFFVPMYMTIWLISKYIYHRKIIITVHNVIPHEASAIKTTLDKMIYRMADTLIVHSQENKQQLINLIWSSKDIHVYAHGMITPQIDAIDQKKAKKDLWIDIEKKVLLQFGHIRPYKGLTVSLQSLQELIQIDPQYHLIIAGKCWEDWDIYASQIQKFALEQHITRISWFLDDTQLSQVFSASDISLLPYTHFDAQSWVVALWLGYNIPMIVSNLWWLTEVIQNPIYISEPWDSTSLTQRIIDIDIKQAKEYISLRKSDFDRDNIVKRYLSDIYA